MEPIIIIEDVHKRLGHVHALKGVSLDILKGEVVVIIGPSGSGDEPDEDAAPDSEVASLRALADRMSTAQKTLTGSGHHGGWAADAGGLTFQLAGLLDVNPAFRQRFLAIHSARHRLALLLQILPGIVADLEARRQSRPARRPTGMEERSRTS